MAARALTNAALVSIQMQQNRQALGFLDRAWEDIKHLHTTKDTVHSLISMGRAYAQLLPLLPGRQNHLVRRVIASFRDAISRAETIDALRAASYAWGYLGQLYEAQQQYRDALQSTRMALLQVQHVHAPESLYRWQWQMGRLLTRMGRPNQAIKAYEDAVETLESFRYETTASYSQTVDFQQAVAPVYFQLVDLLLERANVLEQQPRADTDSQYEHYLYQARTIMEQFKVVELQDYFQDECIQALQAKEKPLEAIIDPNTMVIYPILLPDRTELLVSLSTGLHRFSVPVSSAALTKQVNQFRKHLEHRTTHRYLPYAEQLYTWLIRPLEPLLTPSIETLVFVPDGILRTIPLGALHDGNAFLVEKHAVAMLLGTTLNDPRALSEDDVRVLAAGLTEAVEGFSPLIYASKELEFLEKTYGSKPLLNEKFLAAEIEQAIAQQPFTIVHLATHAQFTGDVETSFLLTYDGKVTMNELRGMINQARYRDEPIELLTLSACETAAGNDRAVLGLAGEVLRAGARSALATLWSINDQASSELVSAFYRELKQSKLSRANALRQAQLTMLKDQRYDHPYYWAPFLLLNTWF